MCQKGYTLADIVEHEYAPYNVKFVNAGIHDYNLYIVEHDLSDYFLSPKQPILVSFVLNTS